MSMKIVGNLILTAWDLVDPGKINGMRRPRREEELFYIALSKLVLKNDKSETGIRALDISQVHFDWGFLQ